MRYKNEKNIFCWFIAVLGCEILLHWLLASNMIPIITTFYLSESKRNSITTLVDNFLPGIVLGIANGWFGWKWSIQKIAISTILLDAGIVASQFLYRPLFRPGLLWWWPPAVGDIIFRIATTLVFLGLFTNAGFKGRKAKLVK